MGDLDLVVVVSIKEAFLVIKEGHKIKIKIESHVTSGACARPHCFV